MLTGTCYECARAFTFAADANLDELECPHCDEYAARTCGLCSCRIRPDLEYHEECDAAEREREARERAEADYEYACDMRGDRMREEVYQ